MTRFVVRPAARPLSGSVPVVSDKSIGHRALMLAALAGGPSTLSGFSYGHDNLSTLAAFRALGIEILDDGAGHLKVAGRGLYGLTPPAAPLDCGNSGTTMRLLAGVLAGQPFASTLVGDASLSRRPMRRIAEPLQLRGARVEGRQVGGIAAGGSKADLTAPLSIGPLAPGERLRPLEYVSEVASAQVKSAVLLSGLYASGPTRFREPLVSRDHTERMLSALGVQVNTAGPLIELVPTGDPMALPGFDLELPGDLSAATFLLSAGAIVDGSTVTVRGTGLNPTRSGAIDAMRAFGLEVGLTPGGDALGEPVGAVTLLGGRRLGAQVGGELALRAIDEIPILCAIAARARGETVFADLAELRVKESDRVRAMVELLTAFGVPAEERPDGMVVEGVPDRPLKAIRVQSHGDHRIAMTAAVLALVSEDVCVVEDVDCVATSFPRFAGTLRALGAEIAVES